MYDINNKPKNPFQNFEIANLVAKIVKLIKKLSLLYNGLSKQSLKSFSIFPKFQNCTNGSNEVSAVWILQEMLAKTKMQNTVT